MNSKIRNLLLGTCFAFCASSAVADYHVQIYGGPAQGALIPGKTYSSYNTPFIIDDGIGHVSTFSNNTFGDWAHADFLLNFGVSGTISAGSENVLVLMGHDLFLSSPDGRPVAVTASIRSARINIDASLGNTGTGQLELDLSGQGFSPAGGTFLSGYVGACANYGSGACGNASVYRRVPVGSFFDLSVAGTVQSGTDLEIGVSAGLSIASNGIQTLFGSESIDPHFTLTVPVGTIVSDTGPFQVSYSVTSVPEPSTYLLFLLGTVVMFSVLLRPHNVARSR